MGYKEQRATIRFEIINLVCLEVDSSTAQSSRTYVGAGGFLGKGLIYGLVKQNDDWNNYIENGCYNVNLDNGINRPLGADDFGFLLVVSYKGVVLTQIFVASITTTTLYFRLKHGDNWSKWQKVTSVRVESSTNII